MFRLWNDEVAQILCEILRDVRDGMPLAGDGLSVPGSTLVTSVGFGVPPKRTFLGVEMERRAQSLLNGAGSSRRRDAPFDCAQGTRFADARDARATRSSAHQRDATSKRALQSFVAIAPFLCRGFSRRISTVASRCGTRVAAVSTPQVVPAAPSAQARRGRRRNFLRRGPRSYDTASAAGAAGAAEAMRAWIVAATFFASAFCVRSKTKQYFGFRSRL